MSQVWTDALLKRTHVLAWIRDRKVDLPHNPVQDRKIGDLNGKLATVRQYLNEVRDEVFDAQGVMISLRREAHRSQDAYEAALMSEIEKTKTWTEEAIKKLPKTADERDRHFRQACLDQYQASQEAERRVEEWEQYQKMLYTIYYSLRDTNNDILTQIAVIKQQYFSGEVELNQKATSLFDILSDDAKGLLNQSGSRMAVEEVDLESDGITAKF